MNFLLLAAALAFQGSPFPTSYLGQTPQMTKVLAKVNGQAITAGEVQRYLWDWKAGEVLDDLIFYRVVQDEADRLGVKLDPREVNAQFDRQLDQLKSQIPQGMTVGEALAQRGMPKSRLYLSIRREMLVNLLALREFSPTQFLRVSTIIVAPSGDSAEALSEAIDKANKAYQRLTSGEKWDEVLKSATNDPRLLESKGVIGWRHMSAFPQSLQTQLKNAKPGEFTKPVQTQFGLQIFRIDARGETLAGAELEDLRAQFLAATRDSLVQRLRQQSKIEKF